MGADAAPLRVVFRVSGGGRQGLGHVIRSLAVASHLKSKLDAQVSFRANPDAAVRRLIEVAGFPCCQGDARHVSDSGRLPVDVWVLDVHGDAAHLVREMRGGWPQAKILALDYFEYDSDCPDAIINLCNHNPTRDRPPDWVAYHQGPQYAIIREEFKSYRRTRESNRKSGDILVCFGSSDVSNSTPTVIEAARLAGIPGATYHVIIGPNVSHREALLQRVSESPIDVQVHVTPPNLPELMASCDLAFCGGGTTMLELAFLGVPSIGIAQTEHEERFAGLLEARGALICLGRGYRCRPTDVAELLVSLSSETDRLRSMSQGGQQLVDGRGIERITEILTRTLTGH